MWLIEKGQRAMRDKCQQDRRPLRQGDVLLRRVDGIPAGLTVVPRDAGRVILAYGEVTGHAHVVEGDVVPLVADVADMRRRFLRVEAESRLVHDEHPPIALLPGVYEVVRQREYAPEAPVWVAD